MKPSELFERYKAHLVEVGGVLTRGSLLHVRTLINISVTRGLDSLSQNFIDKWCEKREKETILSCHKRRGSVRQFLRFTNSQGYTNLELPALLEITPKSERKVRKPMTELPLAKSVITESLEHYIEYLRTIGPKICGTTHKNLIRFNNFLYRNYANATTLTEDMVSAWCDCRETESSSSRNTRVLPVRNFLRHATQREWFEVKVPESLHQEKIPPRDPHIFTNDELTAFFKSTNEITFNKRKYDLVCILKRIQVPVYFRLLFSTGMRTNEARKLRCEDVDLENGVISIVNTKGLDQHRVALHQSMLELLRRYDAAAEKLMSGRKVFFPTIDDHFHNIMWQATIFRKLWKDFSSSDARAYDFRSTYAVNNISSWSYESPAWFDKLIYLSRSMGHRKIESTCYYYHLSPLFPNTLEEKTGDQLRSLLPDFDKYFDHETEY